MGVGSAPTPAHQQTEGEPTPGSRRGASACAKRIRLLNYKPVELLAPARTALVLLRRRFIAIISTAKANLAALVERLFPKRSICVYFSVWAQALRFLLPAGLGRVHKIELCCIRVSQTAVGFSPPRR